VQPYTVQFLQKQAQRTAPTRQFFYHQTHLNDAPICLDVGCGAGAISPEIVDNIPHSTVIGFDIDQYLLHYAASNLLHNPSLHFVFADAKQLPFRMAIADFAFSHFTMMWIQNRTLALQELHRSLSTLGVFACIEPDYTGRIEIYANDSTIKPKPPYPIVTTLTRLGADPLIGGQLPGELANLQFGHIHFGTLSWTFDSNSISEEIKSEAKLIQEKGIEWDLPSFTYTPIFWIHAKKLG
jgi:SAM-dependent methyltransferase